MLFEFIALNTTDKGELYHSIYQGIVDAVNKNIIKKGEQLPSIRDASKQLGVSRTTVENAYTRLCIEGIAQSVPQKGYFIVQSKIKTKSEHKIEKNLYSNIEYDFSGRKTDVAAADTDIWKKMVRSVLWDTGELNSYGDFQGELVLRQALADYSYKARGVITQADNIVVGAGIGPLLNILCGLLGRDITVGIENGGFHTAENIFCDYGIKSVRLDFDKNGALPESIKENNVDVLFLMPSSLSKISVNALLGRRNEYCEWVREDNRLVIEDDYNGELRYTARSVPAFQNKAGDRCVYIGSFSKLLLPSVRIAYMVLPDSMAKELRERHTGYNQTCGKIEQLALERYITLGLLEKHLRKLRRIYYNKSKLLIDCLNKCPKYCKEVILYESSLIVEVNTGLKETSGKICCILRENGIEVMPSEKDGCIRLSFGGICEEDIPEGIKRIFEVLDFKKDF